MGVTVEVIKHGDGKTFPQKGQTVSIHYVGTLQDGTKFDSSRDRGTPFETAIGVGRVIKGWDEGVPQLSVGTTARLICTPDYAYGSRGFPPVIPPNATLTFEVELLCLNWGFAELTSWATIRGPAEVKRVHVRILPLVFLYPVDPYLDPRAKNLVSMEGENRIALCTQCGHSVSVDASHLLEEDALQFIRDGHMPSESSCRAHNAAASAVDSKIKELDGVLDWLRALTEKVQGYRDRLAEFSEQQRALAAPVRRIPPELWETIFRYACAQTTLSYPLEREMLTALSLSRVCSRWRTMAQSDPQLWAPHLLFDVEDLVTDVAAGALGPQVRGFRLAVSFYLARSRSFPLTLEVTWESAERTPRNLERHSKDAHLLLMVLYENFWRWGECTIAGNALMHMLRNRAWPDTPELLVSCCILGQMRGDDRLYDLFSDAPHLTRWTQDFMMLDMALPLSQLTHLKAESIRYRFMAEILRSCESLEVLDVSIHSSSESVRAHHYEKYACYIPVQATLPQLRAFSLAGATSLGLNRILRSLSAPVLSRLTLDPGPHGHPHLTKSDWEALAPSMHSFLGRTSGGVSLYVSPYDDRIGELLENPCVVEVDGRRSIEVA
ncbi:hypothetical protein EV715DRAFT_267887 [Schizophyllum commune]